VEDDWAATSPLPFPFFFPRSAFRRNFGSSASRRRDVVADVGPFPFFPFPGGPEGGARARAPRANKQSARMTPFLSSSSPERGDRGVRPPFPLFSSFSPLNRRRDVAALLGRRSSPSSFPPSLVWTPLDRGRRGRVRRIPFSFFFRARRRPP